VLYGHLRLLVHLYIEKDTLLFRIGMALFRIFRALFSKYTGLFSEYTDFFLENARQKRTAPCRRAALFEYIGLLNRPLCRPLFNE